MEEYDMEEVAMSSRKPKKKKEPKMVVGALAKAKIAKVERMTAMFEKANVAMMSQFNEAELKAMRKAHREMKAAQSLVMDMLRTASNKVEKSEGESPCGYSF